MVFTSSTRSGEEAIKEKNQGTLNNAVFRILNLKKHFNPNYKKHFSSLIFSPSTNTISNLYVKAKKEKNKVRQPKQTKKDQLKSKVNSDFLSKGVKTKAGDNDNEKNNENKLDNDVTSLSSKSFVK